MKIFLAGGTGFLGTYLVPVLEAAGHEVTLLVRSRMRQETVSPGVRIVEGDPTVPGAWQEDLARHEAVINLAGASIFQPWNVRARREILASRLLSTENIVKAIRRAGSGAAHLLNASGVGYYGHCGDETVDEGFPPGDTFLARVARLWEQEALKAGEGGTRVVLLRLAIVLGREGGAFTRIVPLIRFHLGAAWGAGKQWFPWVHEEDAAAMVCFLLSHSEVDGAVNITSPEPVRNRDMVDTMNHLLGKRPVVRSVPGWALRAALGEFSTLFLKGQRVTPRVLGERGFPFRFSSFRDAAADLL